jgi:hypothetical protein
MSHEVIDFKNFEAPCWPFWGNLVEVEIPPDTGIGVARYLVLVDFGTPDYFHRLMSISRNSLAMLWGRRLGELTSMAEAIQAAIDGYIDDYISEETEKYIRRLSESGGWELGYLPKGSQGTEADIRDLLENWGYTWDDRPDLPNREDVLRLDALIDLLALNKEKFNHMGQVEPEECELFAVLALMTICEAVHSNPSNSPNPKSISEALLIGNASIEAVEIFCYAERVQSEQRIRKAAASELPGILDAEFATRSSERARSGAVKRSNGFSPARNFVAEEWTRHREQYAGNKSEFARIYVRRVLNEFGTRVTEKTIREAWLSHNPGTGKQTG